jgi:hypothetical protein
VQVCQENHRNYLEAIEHEGALNSRQLCHLLHHHAQTPDLLALLDNNTTLLVVPNDIKTKISGHFTKMAKEPTPITAMDLPWCCPTINRHSPLHGRIRLGNKVI